MHAQAEEYTLVWSRETGYWVYSVSISADGEYVAASGWSVYLFESLHAAAKIAISSAKAAISSVKSNDYAVLQAESLLKQAEEAFEAGDYQTARKLAIEARERAKKYLGAAYIFELLLALAAVALVYALYRLLRSLYLRWKRAREGYERKKAEVIRELEEVIAMLEEWSRRV